MFLEALTRDFSEIQKYVEDRLAETPEFALADEAPCPKDKWLLSSALQKLIRQGRPEEAIRVALALHEVDRGYLPRRLPIIAFEDVGMADLVLCFDVLVAFGPGRMGYRSVAQLEERALIRNVVFRLAGAVKSRTACDLLCLAHEPALLAARAEELAKQGPEALVHLVAERYSGETRRALALHVLSGMSLRRGQWFRPISRFNAQALAALAGKLELPPIVHWLMVQGRNTAGLAAMLPLVLEAVRRNEEGLCVRESPELFTEPRIFGFPPAALDQHTRLGRQAIDRFAVFLRKEEWRYFGHIAATRFTPIVGMALFHVEGSRLERSLSCAELERYRERVEIAELERQGLPGRGLRHELYRSIAQEARTLWSLRWRVCKGAFGTPESGA